jgi:uncharacterized protein (TIGR04168 family)
MLIAVIGDVHMCWDDDDVRWFDRSDYDLILFVGDLAGYMRDGSSVARSIARLSKPALFLPGNHDSVGLAHLAAEAFEQDSLVRLLEGAQSWRCRALADALGPVPMCGYSSHDFEVGALQLSVVAARPHAMGGDRFHYRRHLKERFGVDSFESSAAKLASVIDDCSHDDLLFLAHNGPTGLGASRDDIWGCDFRPELGDFGDRDLQSAIEHATRSGKRVRAVVAGHMHHALKGGGTRKWKLIRDDVVYVNAARVPRIFNEGDRVQRHHVRLALDADEVVASEKLVSL